MSAAAETTKAARSSLAVSRLTDVAASATLKNMKNSNGREQRQVMPASMTASSGRSQSEGSVLRAVAAAGGIKGEEGKDGLDGLRVR